MKKVLMPEWWSEGEKVYGFTDAEDTYCCELQPSWFVTVPAADYEGYFHVKDLNVVDAIVLACVECGGPVDFGEACGHCGTMATA